jgi:hypothetical protein
MTNIQRNKKPKLEDKTDMSQEETVTNNEQTKLDKVITYIRELTYAQAKILHRLDVLEKNQQNNKPVCEPNTENPSLLIGDTNVIINTIRSTKKEYTALCETVKTGIAKMLKQYPNAQKAYDTILVSFMYDTIVVDICINDSSKFNLPFWQYVLALNSSINVSAGFNIKLTYKVSNSVYLGNVPNGCANGYPIPPYATPNTGTGGYPGTVYPQNYPITPGVLYTPYTIGNSDSYKTAHNQL